MRLCLIELCKVDKWLEFDNGGHSWSNDFLSFICNVVNRSSI